MIAPASIGGDDFASLPSTDLHETVSEKTGAADRKLSSAGNFDFFVDLQIHVNTFHVRQDHGIVFDGTDFCAGKKDACALVDAARVRILDADPVIAVDAVAKAAEINDHQPDGEETKGHEDTHPQLRCTFLGRHTILILVIL